MLVKNMVAVITMVMALTATLTTHAAPITDLRNSVSPARVRFVLDSEKLIEYKAERAGKKIIVKLPKSGTKQKNLLVRDNIVRSAQLVPTGRNASQLTINMLKECQYKVLQYAQHSENKDHGIWSHHFMGNRWGNNGKCQTLFFWAPKSLQMVTTAMKLKDAYSLEEKL